MKKSTKILVYPLAIILMSLFIIIGCSDDDTEPGSHNLTDIDGNEYKTVIIGDKIWMAENLRVTAYNNGDAIPSGLSNSDWESTTDGAYAIYNHHAPNTAGINSPEEMVAAYGKLYNWYAVNDARGLCPEGWSVPSETEWRSLVNYITDYYDYHNDYENDDINAVGNALKSCRQLGHPDDGDCDTSKRNCAHQHPR